jgi:retron-type reverse transcriptase
MQREDKPVMTTGLERIAVKARCEPKLRFTSLAHHITKERVWENLNQIPAKSAAGVDGQTVTEAKESFEEWVADMLQSVHREGYRAPDIRRVYIPKPGKQEMRPLGVPTVADRALQRSVSQVLSAIYEQDFSTLLIRWTCWKRCPPSACNAPRENCWRENRVGVGGGPQELFREPKPRVDAPLRGTSSGRSAPD